MAGSIEYNRKMPQDALREFQEFVFSNAGVQDRLRAIEDRFEFIEETTQAGREHGYIFTKEDVEECLVASRRRWLERWI